MTNTTVDLVETLGQWLVAQKSRLPFGKTDGSFTLNFQRKSSK
jgi:hypothetical protein